MVHDSSTAFGPFTPQAREVLKRAQAAAHQRGQDAVGTDDLMIGLLAVQDATISQLFRHLGMTLEQIRALIEPLDSTVEPVRAPQEERSSFELRLTPQARQALKRAMGEVRRFKRSHLGTEHLLLGLLDESEGMAAHLLRRVGVEAKHIRDLTEEQLH